MIVVDHDGLRKALGNLLPPNLVFVSGQWDRFDGAVVIRCQGLAVAEIIAILCDRIGVPDLLVPVPLLTPCVVACLDVTPGDVDMLRLVQTPSIFYGLRLIVATKYPLLVPCEGSVASQHFEVRLSDGQLVQFLHEKTEAAVELIRFTLNVVTTRDVAELQHILLEASPIFNRSEPGTALQKITPFLGSDDRLLHMATTATKWDKDIIPADMNKLSMYILVAAFLASFNPVGSDRQMFLHEAARRGKRRGKRDGNDGTLLGPLFLGPKEFGLDRMLSIIENLYRDRNGTKDVYIQISDLVAMKFLAIISGSTNAGRSVLDATKLRCLIDRQMATALADKLGLNLSHYLHCP